MPKARLSRAERQAETREKLLATARECFLRDGYGPTTLEGIAEAAGYSKGAVYSNFKNKDELCLAVLESVREARASSLAASILGAESLAERIDAFEAWAEHNIGDRAWTSLEIEFAVHAGRHPELARRLVEGNEAIRQLIVGVVREHATRSLVDLPLPAEDVGLALLGLGVGLGLQRALDPSLSVRPLGQLVRLFTTLGSRKAFEARAGAPPRARRTKKSASSKQARHR